MKSLGEKMLQRTVHFSAVAAMTSLLSIAILISAAHFDAAQAQKVGQQRELAAKNCENSAAVHRCLETTCSNASKGTRTNSPKDVLHWRIILCAAVTGMRRSGARATSRAEAVFLHV
jgi:hypothetical protein